MTLSTDFQFIFNYESQKKVRDIELATTLVQPTVTQVNWFTTLSPSVGQHPTRERGGWTARSLSGCLKSTYHWGRQWRVLSLKLNLFCNLFAAYFVWGDTHAFTVPIQNLFTKSQDLIPRKQKNEKVEIENPNALSRARSEMLACMNG